MKDPTDQAPETPDASTEDTSTTTPEWVVLIDAHLRRAPSRVAMTHPDSLRGFRTCLVTRSG